MLQEFGIAARTAHPLAFNQYLQLVIDVGRAERRMIPYVFADRGVAESWQES
jgi:hypothetical protein